MLTYLHLVARVEVPEKTNIEQQTFSYVGSGDVRRGKTRSLERGGSGRW
jgi:hypothetical protein